MQPYFDKITKWQQRNVFNDFEHHRLFVGLFDIVKNLGDRFVEDILKGNKIGGLIIAE